MNGTTQTRHELRDGESIAATSFQLPAWRELVAIALAIFCLADRPSLAGDVLVEAEGFERLGGWEVDQQAMDVMGSPYLLAHGLGVPVADAVTTVALPEPGVYHVWVRTRDWVATWNQPGAPGKFEVIIDGQPLATVFGTEGAEWHWQAGGAVTLGRRAEVRLHDLTGFAGRCDAIVFARDAGFRPPNADPEMAAFRRRLLGLEGVIDDGGRHDLVVVGGGLAGIAAALSAARQGLDVALVQDRPVLGGNSSSEIRVWPEGKTCQEPFPRVGEIVEEICPAPVADVGIGKRGEIYDDARKLRLVRAEPRITLLLEQRVGVVEMRGRKIVSVTAQHIRSGRRTRIHGTLFADCTGDGTVGFLAGADHETSTEGMMGASNPWNVIDQADRKEVLGCECKDKEALAVRTAQGDVAAPFPRVPWAIDLAERPLPGRKRQGDGWTPMPLKQLGGWFWESGFALDQVRDVERIRDNNLRAMYGAWDALKNVDGLYPNHRLGWAAFIAGKRESRRLLGDVVLKGDDFRRGTTWPDPAFPATWYIDLHSPHPDFKDVGDGDPFIARDTHGPDAKYQGPYWAPYRCLYSRNTDNLFMAGRDISVEREALGPVRVMRTCGMMGEIVGKAAAICVRHETSPRGVYESHLPELQDLMRSPGTSRRASR